MEHQLKKIICPTDLSEASRNAAAYAAKLCQLTHADLELIYVEPVMLPEMVFAGRKKLREVLEWSEALHQFSNEINKLFHISCSCDIETSNKPIGQVISEKAGVDALIVVGTNGADNLFQQIFGSNAYNIALMTNAKVLVVPVGVEYSTITKICMGWDYKLSSNLIHSIRKFTTTIGAQLSFVHVSTHVSQISKDVFRAVSNLVKEQADPEEQITFQQVHGQHVFDALDYHLRKEHSAMLAVSIKSGKLIHHLFGTIRDAEHLPSYPILVLHD